MSAKATHQRPEQNQAAVPERQGADPCADAASSRQRDQTDERTEQSERDQVEFLSFVAHEVRNPLVPIQSAVEVLRQPTTTDAQRKRAVEIIDSQVLELRRVLDELLDFSRIARGKIELLKQPIRLADVVAGVVETSRPPIEKQGHRLGVTLPAEPVWLMADSTRLAQIVSGLLHHAAKSCVNGGAIKLSAAVEGDEVLLTVEDNGGGIRREDLPHIFDLFAQGDRLRRCAAAAWSTGLASIRTLVQLHGGSVDVQSDGPGRGSKFQVRLPRLSITETHHAAESSKVTHAILQLPTLRILLVADNAEFAKDWCLLLRVAGHEVRTAGSSQETMEAAIAFRPQVVCIDIDIPDMDVRAMPQRLREKPCFEKALVIALADSKHQEKRRAALDAGCAALLFKPVKIRDFLQLISAHAAELAEVPGSAI